MKKRKKSSLLFRFIKYFVRLFSPKMKISGAESLPDEPCIIIGNHSQLYGPIACELYLPESTYTWCAHEMMELSEVPAYTFADFWSQKPKAQQPFFKAHPEYVCLCLCFLLWRSGHQAYYICISTTESLRRKTYYIR